MLKWIWLCREREREKRYVVNEKKKKKPIQAPSMRESLDIIGRGFLFSFFFFLSSFFLFKNQTIYREAKRSSILPKNTMGRGSRILSSEPKFLCSSSRSMMEGCLKMTLLMVEAAEVEEVTEAHEVLLEWVEVRRKEKRPRTLEVAEWP